MMWKGVLKGRGEKRKYKEQKARGRCRGRVVLFAAALAFIVLNFRGKSPALTTDSYFFQKESAVPLTSEPRHTGFDGGTGA